MPATIVGRCQRFDFRRASTDVIADHLVRVAGEEGIKLAAEAAETMARQAEGSFRDALSLLDQASVLGGAEIGEEVLAQLLGAPRAEVQFALADAVAVGDTAGVFELVDRLVQEGQDLRHATSESMQHFRNLLIANTAPGQADLLDLPADEYELLRAQASKFQPSELSRVIGLLLAAQTDMRWTTSPRLTLELALVRATMPEADPAPEALVARMERLERLAGLQGGAPAVEPAGSSPLPQPIEDPDSGHGRASERLVDDPPPAAPAAASKEPAAQAQAPTPPSTESVDVQMLRRSWPTLVEHLRTARQMILSANLESVTPISFDGTTLELSFPPGREYGVAKVQGRDKDLRAALQDLFGISPEVKYIVREPVAGSPTQDIEEEPPMSEEAALARLQAELDAQIAPDRDA
jgi:DNA polymerase-3 subunit gamma/tau